MPIKWKKRFNPLVILTRINDVRTVNPQGGASFRGFDLNAWLPALHSMLEFPDVTSDFEPSALVSSALIKASSPITPDSFLATINAELSTVLNFRECGYRLLTTISMHPKDLPNVVSIFDAKIRFLEGNFSKKYSSRDALLLKNPVPLEKTPDIYCKAVVELTAKSTTAAVNKALKVLDLQRAILCLLRNPAIQITFGAGSLKPINVVRLGGCHTLHLIDGSPAVDTIWFDPDFVLTSVGRVSKLASMRKSYFWFLKRLANGYARDQIISSLVRYVRALDGRNLNAAFIQLWGALESLATPGVADYDRLVKRCSFLFQDRDYHRQMLEHLREYRNESVHAGEQSDRARILCYQLQQYFAVLISFHLRHSMYFTSLDEANSFLDSTSDKKVLRRQIMLSRKVMKFIG